MRVSTLMQSPRSPEQQREEIDKAIARLRRPWQTVGEYCDRGISGRFVNKRPGLRQLLLDVESGAIKIDAVLVDTYERWGRQDEMRVLRRSLWNNHHVLLLTVDSDFSDPTTEAGRALAFLEQVRATSANAIRAHDISRGKADAVRQKHWPGGRVPFGYSIQWHCHDRCSYATLEPDPQTAPLIQKIFKWAAQSGIGGLRLARLFNQDPQIPECYKPILSRTLNVWLKNQIYLGRMIWGRTSHGIIEDVCIARANPPEEHVVVDDFCLAIISGQLWEQVQVVREARRQAARGNTLQKKTDRTVVPSIGKSLHSRLTGLVHCGVCGRRMRHHGYKTGDRIICRFWCDGHLEGFCSNGCRVREDFLWRDVEKRLRMYLGLPEEEAQGLTKPPAPVTAVAERLRQFALQSQYQIAPTTQALEKRMSQLNKRMEGWVKSLGKCGISWALRQRLSVEYTRAKDECDQLCLELSRLHAASNDLHESVNEEQALARLNTTALLVSPWRGES
jgi:DNA invertase Pin-like site-specific DNA recombinase